MLLRASEEGTMGNAGLQVSWSANLHGSDCTTGQTAGAGSSRRALHGPSQINLSLPTHIVGPGRVLDEGPSAARRIEEDEAQEEVQDFRLHRFYGGCPICGTPVLVSLGHRTLLVSYRSLANHPGAAATLP